METPYTAGDVKAVFNNAELLMRASAGDKNVSFDAAKRLFESSIRNVASKLEPLA
jgi:hypothetical protein